MNVTFILRIVVCESMCCVHVCSIAVVRQAIVLVIMNN